MGLLHVTCCLALMQPSRALAGLPRITTEELAMTAPKVEPGADVEALLCQVSLEDRWEGGNVIASQEQTIRLKLFTQRAVEQFKTVELVYPATATLGRLNAKTILPDGREVRVPAQAMYGQVLFRKQGVAFYRKAFAPQDLTVGCILEYNYWFYGYDETSDYDHIEVQRDFPIERLELRVHPLSLSGLNLQMMSISFNLPPVAFVDEGQDQYLATLTDVRAFHAEPEMPAEDQVKSWILVYYTQRPEPSASDFWRGFSQRNYSSFHASTTPNGPIRDGLAKIPHQGGSDDRLRDIFEWCQTRIGNLTTDTTRSLTERSKTTVSVLPEETLQRGYGRPSEVALLFGALARAAGFETRPAFINSSRTSSLNLAFGQSYFLDARCVAVATHGGWRFLFPGVPGIAYGEIPEGLEGRHAVIADPESLIVASTPPSDPEQTLKVSSARLRMGADGSVDGDLKVMLTGQLARARFVEDLAKSQAQRVEDWYGELHERAGEGDLTQGAVEMPQNGGGQYVFLCHLHCAEYARPSERQFAVPCAYFRRRATPFFTSATRRWPIALPFAWTELDSVRIELPDLAVKPDLPADAQVNLESWGSYVRSASIDGTSILCVRRQVFGLNGTLDFSRASYSTIKDRLEDVREADAAWAHVALSKP